MSGCFSVIWGNDSRSGIDWFSPTVDGSGDGVRIASEVSMRFPSLAGNSYDPYGFGERLLDLPAGGMTTTVRYDPSSWANLDNLVMVS